MWCHIGVSQDSTFIFPSHPYEVSSRNLQALNDSDMTIFLNRYINDFNHSESLHDCGNNVPDVADVGIEGCTLSYTKQTQKL